MRPGRFQCGAILVAAGVLLAGRGTPVRAAVDTSRLPPAAERAIDYEREVRPIFEAACFRCHGPERPKAGFRLDNRESALKGGEGGVAIVPGQSADSRLVHYVAGLVEEMRMPPPGKGESLTTEQVGVLRAWIDQNAPYPAAAARPLAPVVFLASPTLRWVTVSGNEAKFREHQWMPQGFSGGIERFEWQEPLGAGRKFAADGRFISDAGDYRVRLAFEDQNLGFVRAGFEQFRKWSEDSGGYYAPFGQPPIALGRDLELDLGRAWFEVGLHRPHLPQITVGYEYAYRDGEKSTLQWGEVGDPVSFEIMFIYPSSKGLDEEVHRVKLDFRHVIAGIDVEDNFRGEFVTARNQRSNVEYYTYGDALPSLVRDLRESYSYFQGANALRLEKPVKNWLFLTAGYLYSNLDGDSGFGMTLTDPRDPTLAPFESLVSPEMVLHREAHVFNANAQVQPWRMLSLTAGVQSDWSRQEGFGNTAFNNLPTAYSANIDRVAVNEHFGLRFRAIPFTVVYAEARLEQESIGQYEQGMATPYLPPTADFLRDTDARADRLDFRGGLTVSPWTRASLDLSYRHRDSDADFDHLADRDLSATPGNGYPAFIRARDQVTDEGELRLVLHPSRWLKTTLGFQPVGTEFHTTTSDWVDPGGELQPGSRLLSGNYDAQNYRLSLTVTPWRRLYVTTTFVYGDSRIENGLATGGPVGTYAGDQYSLTTSSTFALSQQADLTATYTFSCADFSPGAATAALPLGIVYDQHAVAAGLNRRFKHQLSASLQYGFYLYREPTAAGALDYTAHAIFATVSKKFR